MRYRLLLLKRLAEDICMYPLIIAGRLIAVFKPLSKEFTVFYFFPFYHTGGAEKVHALVAKATGGKDCLIFFTRKSHNRDFLPLFTDTGCVLKDISRYTDNKWIYFVNIIFRGIVSGYINHQKKSPLVFNGQCNFAYKISPWVNNHIRQIELIHSISNFSYIRIPFLPFISRTVMISTVKIEEHLNLYRRYGIPLAMGEKIQFIMNAIDLPQTKPAPKMSNDGLTVLYVGRGTPEKRVHLIAEAAAEIRKKEPAIRFRFLGEVANAIPDGYKPDCELLGNQSDEAVVQNVYAGADILILLSDTEGFPMVIMEAMAQGLAIVATGVGEIPLHIKNNISGFVIGNYREERSVVSQSVKAIFTLFQNRDLLAAMSAHNIGYAYQHFGLGRFEQEYRRLFFQTNAE